MTAVVLMIAVAVLDQITKTAVLMKMNIGAGIDVIPGFFTLCHVHNYGAAWGSFSGYRWILISISLAVLAVLCKQRKIFLSGNALSRTAFGLLLGGIIGNLLDRIRLGYVVDFLDFYTGNSHFPAFNVADSAICIGVALIWIASIPHNSAPFGSSGKKQSETEQK